MKKIIIANAFSVNMLQKPLTTLTFRRVTEEEVINLISSHTEIDSVIGHEATASLLSKRLGIEIPVKRVEYKMTPNDILVVCVLAKRLDEGKVLTEDELKNFPLSWFIIEIKEEK